MGVECGVATYGQRFKAMRLGAGWRPGKRQKFTQEAVAKRLAFKRAAPVSLIETSDTVPKPVTIAEHAKALECQPWELLLGVPTDYDRLRFHALKPEELENLVAGLVILPPEQRTAILRSCEKAVRRLPDPLIPAETRPVRGPTPAKQATAAHTHRGKKRA